MTARWVLLLVIASACASGRRGEGSGGGDAAQHDTPIGTSDGPPVTDAPKTDAPPTDAPTDATGGGLDPDLELPDPGGQVCDEPGRGPPECPLAQVCRYFTPTEGRCESCTSCGNLGDSCSATSQCDIVFECYQGQCTNFCTLGTIECGPPADCLNIGHATRGVCRP